MAYNVYDIDYKKLVKSASAEGQENEAGSEESWLTTEQIAVKPVYDKSDLGPLEHLHYAAGIQPFLRGPSVETDLARTLKSLSLKIGRIYIIFSYFNRPQR